MHRYADWFPPGWLYGTGPRRLVAPVCRGAMCLECSDSASLPSDKPPQRAHKRVEQQELILLLLCMLPDFPQFFRRFIYLNLAPISGREPQERSLPKEE